METLTNPKETLIQALTLTFCKTVIKRIVFAVLYVYGVGLPEAVAFSGICEKSARKYRGMLNSGDSCGLLRISSGTRPSKLGSVEELICAELDKGMYRTLRQIKLKVKELFGIEISRGRLSVFLKANGYRILRCASLPAKADFAEQRRYYREEMMPLMAAAKRNELVLQYMDAAHFVYGTPTPGAVYTKIRRAIRTFNGRMRHNVLASVDFVTKAVTTVANDTYITAVEVVAMLEKLAVQYAGKTIVIILDNARYQRCEAVKACAERLGILLGYLPTYSPNLNLIERFWKYIKSEVLNAAYLDSFDKFKLAIANGIHDSFTYHKDRLDSLFTFKVQLFDDQGLSIPFDHALLFPS